MMEWHEWDRATRKLSREGKWKFRAGMVVKDKKGGVHLVGNVNEVLGLCACCNDLWDENIAAWAWADAKFLATLQRPPEED